MMRVNRASMPAQPTSVSPLTFADTYGMATAGAIATCHRRERGGSARHSSSRECIGSPELVAEVKFLIWTNNGLLRQVIYQGLRDDKPAAGVRRPGPRPSRRLIRLIRPKLNLIQVQEIIDHVSALDHLKPRVGHMMLRVLLRVPVVSPPIRLFGGPQLTGNGPPAETKGRGFGNTSRMRLARDGSLYPAL